MRPREREARAAEHASEAVLLAQAVEREVEQGVRGEGMFYVDTRSAFQGTNPRDFWIYELDPHPNREAHAIFADVIAEFLRAHHLLGR